MSICVCDWYIFLLLICLWRSVPMASFIRLVPIQSTHLFKWFVSENKISLITMNLLINYQWIWTILLIVLINSKLSCNLVCIQKLFHEYCDLPYQIELKCKLVSRCFSPIFCASQWNVWKSLLTDNVWYETVNGECTCVQFFVLREYCRKTGNLLFFQSFNTVKSWPFCSFFLHILCNMWTYVRSYVFI